MIDSRIVDSPVSGTSVLDVPQASEQRSFDQRSHAIDRWAEKLEVPLPSDLERKEDLEHAEDRFYEELARNPKDIAGARRKFSEANEQALEEIRQRVRNEEIKKLLPDQVAGLLTDISDVAPSIMGTDKREQTLDSLKQQQKITEAIKDGDFRMIYLGLGAQWSILEKKSQQASSADNEKRAEELQKIVATRRLLVESKLVPSRINEVGKSIVDIPHWSVIAHRPQELSQAA